MDCEHASHAQRIDDEPLIAISIAIGRLIRRDCRRHRREARGEPGVRVLRVQNRAGDRPQREAGISPVSELPGAAARTPPSL